MKIPNFDPGNGYEMGEWTRPPWEKYPPTYQAWVWKHNVLPPPETSVKAQVTLYPWDIERAGENLDSLIKLQIEAAVASCEYLLGERAKES